MKVLVSHSSVISSRTKHPWKRVHSPPTLDPSLHKDPRFLGSSKNRTPLEQRLVVETSDIGLAELLPDPDPSRKGHVLTVPACLSEFPKRSFSAVNVSEFGSYGIACTQNDVLVIWNRRTAASNTIVGPFGELLNAAKSTPNPSAPNTPEVSPSVSPRKTRPSPSPSISRARSEASSLVGHHRELTVPVDTQNRMIDTPRTIRSKSRLQKLSSKLKESLGAKNSTPRGERMYRRVYVSDDGNFVLLFTSATDVWLWVQSNREWFHLSGHHVQVPRVTALPDKFLRDSLEVTFGGNITSGRNVNVCHGTLATVNSKAVLLLTLCNSTFDAMGWKEPEPDVLAGDPQNHRTFPGTTETWQLSLPLITDGHSSANRVDLETSQGFQCPSVISRWDPIGTLLAVFGNYTLDGRRRSALFLLPPNELNLETRCFSVNVGSSADGSQRSRTQLDGVAHVGAGERVWTTADAAWTSEGQSIAVLDVEGHMVMMTRAGVALKILLRSPALNVSGSECTSLDLKVLWGCDIKQRHLVGHTPGRSSVIGDFHTLSKMSLTSHPLKLSLLCSNGFSVVELDLDQVTEGGIIAGLSKTQGPLVGWRHAMVSSAPQLSFQKDLLPSILNLIDVRSDLSFAKVADQYLQRHASQVSAFPGTDALTELVGMHEQACVAMYYNSWHQSCFAQCVSLTDSIFSALVSHSRLYEALHVLRIAETALNRYFREPTEFRAIVPKTSEADVAMTPSLRPLCFQKQWRILATLAASEEPNGSSNDWRYLVEVSSEHGLSPAFETLSSAFPVTDPVSEYRRLAHWQFLGGNVPQSLKSHSIAGRDSDLEVLCIHLKEANLSEAMAIADRHSSRGFLHSCTILYIIGEFMFRYFASESLSVPAPSALASLRHRIPDGSSRWTAAEWKTVIEEPIRGCRSLRVSRGHVVAAANKTPRWTAVQGVEYLMCAGNTVAALRSSCECEEWASVIGLLDALLEGPKEDILVGKRVVENVMLEKIRFTVSRKEVTQWKWQRALRLLNATDLIRRSSGLPLFDVEEDKAAEGQKIPIATFPRRNSGAVGLDQPRHTLFTCCLEQFKKRLSLLALMVPHDFPLPPPPQLDFLYQLHSASLDGMQSPLRIGNKTPQVKEEIEVREVLCRLTRMILSLLTLPMLQAVRHVVQGPGIQHVPDEDRELSKLLAPLRSLCRLFWYSSVRDSLSALWRETSLTGDVASHLELAFWTIRLVNFSDIRPKDQIHELSLTMMGNVASTRHIASLLSWNLQEKDVSDSMKVRYHRLVDRLEKDYPLFKQRLNDMSDENNIMAGSARDVFGESKEFCTGKDAFSFFWKLEQDIEYVGFTRQVLVSITSNWRHIQAANPDLGIVDELSKLKFG